MLSVYGEATPLGPMALKAPNVPQVPPASGAEARSSWPEAGLRPESESLAEKVTATEVLVT